MDNLATVVNLGGDRGYVIVMLFAFEEKVNFTKMFVVL